MESILTSIKKLLGIDESDDHFDPDIIMHINTALMELTQMGVGPPEGFRIEGEHESWTDFILEKDNRFEGVKTYIYLYVRLVFDPPAQSAVAESIKQTLSRLEWRLNVAAEST